MIAMLDGIAATMLGTMAAVALARRRLLPAAAVDDADPAAAGRALHRARDRHGDRCCTQLGITSVAEAVLAGHVVISLPYSLLVVLPRLRTLDASIVEAARDLGAAAVKAFCWSPCRCWRRRWCRAC